MHYRPSFRIPPFALDGDVSNLYRTPSLLQRLRLVRSARKARR